MTITIGIVLVVLLLMVLILFFLLKQEVKDIDNRSKVYFTRKAQEYTDSITRDTTSSSDTTSRNEKELSENEENENNKTSVIYVEKKANYEINDLLKMMKQIDEKFSINDMTTLRNFIKNYVHNDKDKISRYNSLKEMKQYVDKVGVFNILVNDDESSFDAIVHDLRLIDEDIFMEYYSDKNSLEIEDFCNFLDYEIGKCDPTIYVYVGNEKTNYDKIDKRIKTIYSSDIYKGLKIVYLNKLYDYSLS